MSLKENTTPCPQRDTSALKLCKSRRRRRCTVSASPLRVWLFHKQIHANRGRSRSPIINLRRQLDFGQILLPSHTGSWTWPAVIFMLSSVWISWCGPCGSLRKTCQHSDAQRLWLSDDLLKLITRLHKSHSDKGFSGLNHQLRGEVCNSSTSKQKRKHKHFVTYFVWKNQESHHKLAAQVKSGWNTFCSVLHTMDILICEAAISVMSVSLSL